MRCLAAAPPGGAGPRLRAEESACGLHEPPADCDDCRACCREAFDAVPVEEDHEEVRLEAAFPGFVLRAQDGWRHLRRVPSPVAACATRCAALRGEGSSDAPFRCVVYALRPETCRDLAAGSEACLHARRRVGRSPWPPGMIPDGPLFRAE